MNFLYSSLVLLSLQEQPSSHSGHCEGDFIPILDPFVPFSPNITELTDSQCMVSLFKCCWYFIVPLGLFTQSLKQTSCQKLPHYVSWQLFQKPQIIHLFSTNVTVPKEFLFFFFGTRLL